MSIRALEQEAARQSRRRRWGGVLFGIFQLCLGLTAIFFTSIRIAGIVIVAIGIGSLLFALVFPDRVFNFVRWVLAGAFTGSALGLLCAGLSLPQYLSTGEFVGALATDVFILAILAALGGVIGVVIGLIQMVRGKSLSGDDVASGIGEVGDALSNLDG